MSDERARAARGYLEAKIRSASPAELISILYEGLARELRLAASCVERGDVAARGVAVGHALGIICELRTSLNHETGGAVATNLERLYAFWTRSITEANAASSRAPIDRVTAQLEPIRTAWNQAVLRSVPAAQAGAGATAGASAGASVTAASTTPGPAAGAGAATGGRGRKRG